jgi:hypothetical protein
MMGPTHRLLGALTGAGYAAATGKPTHDHGPGIPLAPWGCYFGVGWKTDGILESGRRIGPLRIPSLTRAVLTVALAAVLTVSTGLNLTELAHRVGGA